MPRMARLVVPGYPHHVTQRGNRRQAVFLRDGDWSPYLDLMRTACLDAGTRVLAYCLMPNHVHFVLVPSHADGLRAAFADAHRRYTRSVNFREGWCGHLWQERFHSFVMDEANLRAAMPYVEENPVRAGLCDEPSTWRWSSAAERIADADVALMAWKLRRRILETSDSYGTDGDPKLVDSLRLHTRTGRPLGSDRFIGWLESVTGRLLRPQKRGPKTSEVGEQQEPTTRDLRQRKLR